MKILGQLLSKARSKAALIIICFVISSLLLLYYISFANEKNITTTINFNSYALNSVLVIEQQQEKYIGGNTIMKQHKLQNKNKKQLIKRATSKKINWMELRMKMPQPCNETEWKLKLQRMEKMNLIGFKNYMPFINRCNLRNTNALYMYPNMEVYEMWLNNKIAYQHIFKVGGTSIMHTLELMVKNNIISRSSKYPYFINKANPTLKPHRMHTYKFGVFPVFPNYTSTHFHQWLKNIFFFTYVRDPITKFLSGFFEMCVRKKSKWFRGRKLGTNVSGIQLLRSLMQTMSQNMMQLQSSVLTKFDVFVL